MFNNNYRNLTLEEFVLLLDYLDKNEEGQNLRIYPDGSSYIANDNGIEVTSFEDMSSLINYLSDLKIKYDSGERIFVDRN